MTVKPFAPYLQMITPLASRIIKSKKSLDLSVTSNLGIPAALILLESTQGQSPNVSPEVAAHAPSSKELATSLLQGFRALAELSQNSCSATLTDAAGHQRSEYHLLVLHLHLLAFLQQYETMPPDLWAACESHLDQALSAVREVEQFANQAPPPNQSAFAMWQALCLLEASSLQSRDADRELAESVIHFIATRPGRDNSFSPQDPQESPDAWVYRELVGLHALANAALRQRNQTWACRVREIANYHLENTQPDNTTNEPWGVFGFIWSPSANSFAEQQIHDCMTYGPTPIAAMLLADACYALATF